MGQGVDPPPTNGNGSPPPTNGYAPPPVVCGVGGGCVQWYGLIEVNLREIIVNHEVMNENH